MTQYERQGIERSTAASWTRLSVLSGIVGGALMVLTSLALFSVLNELEFAFVDPLGAVAMVLLALALPALYAHERGWFGRLATVTFWLLSLGWVVATVGLVVTTLTMPPVSETAFLAFLLGLLVAMLGALAFGVAILRADTTAIPRTVGWLLVAALPVGVPLALGFTTYVMGEAADPWGGPMLFYGLAWVVLGRYLWTHESETAGTAAADAR
ncbi:hypothetical protein [Halogeometricum luteum]|uniref:Uncharacterized protein n=1 Tax=Halogeometricum luteum TaxID=2950537 RepID=A0ABU2G5U1_9EURY|nr:hypothetical protein [Halogeometricum sp. S3BR5-2]MDS0296162.1 hypothetical protein [Halogeometricum sp. S3BR5-2]